MCKQGLQTRDLDFYRGYLLREEHTPSTVENYLRNARSFAMWLGSRAVTKELAADWKGHLLVQGLAPATVNAKLSALNSLLRFLGREEYQRLLSTARERNRERLALLLETICATGIRVPEVRYITMDAVRRGRTDVTLKGKIRTILLPGKLYRKLLKYAKKCGTASGEIFRAKSGASLSRKQIWREMKSLCAAAKVEPPKVFPHNLRRLFATVFYRTTQDIVKLADPLGHSSIDTTRIYLLTTGTEHARQLGRLGLVS